MFHFLFVYIEFRYKHPLLIMGKNKFKRGGFSKPPSTRGGRFQGNQSRGVI